MESNGEIHKKASRDPTPDTLSNGLALEGEDSSSSSEDKFICGICNGKFKVPKVLHCLHAFCEACLEKSLEESGRTQLVCHTCKQITRLTMAGGVGELPIDAVIVNMMEMEAICSMQVICTSCKAQENAVARCSDCSNFLCSNCVTAHNYMRVFDSHKVETFDELKNGKGIHKPMYCIVHPTEHFKFYCRTCQVLTCAECMLYLHKQPDHHCERIVDIDRDQRAELKAIVTETKSKMSAFEDTSGKLESLLSDLQQQRDNAHDLIKETFQSYKATLEKRKDDLIKELEDIHSEKELTVMEMFHNLGKTVDKMEDACKFMERLVEHADAVEMMAVSKIVRAQMALLNDEVPRSDMSVKIEVESDPNKFAEATRQFFCAFKRPDSGNNAYQTAVNACGVLNSKPTLFDVQLNHHHAHAANGLVGSHHSSTTSLPTGNLIPNNNPIQQSSSTSFEMDRFKMLDPSSNPLNLPSELLSSLAANLTPPLLNDLASSIATSLPPNSNLSSLSQTLSFADRSLSRNSYSPTISDSGVSVDVSSTSNQQTLHQLQQLIKMGNLGLNPQGQLTMNGQVVPGLQGMNWNVPSGLGPQNPLPLGGRGVVPPISSDNSIASLLSQTPNPLGGTTPTISELSALLSSLNPHQSISLGAMQSTSPVNGANGSVSLLPGQPPNLPLNGVFQVPPSSYPAQGPSSIRARSSGKTNSMEIRTKFGQLGPGKGQFNAPHGFCLGMDEDIVVADTNNHRIQVFDKSGEFKYQFGIPGREEGQLWYPRKVAVIRTSGRYVVCDRGSERSRMQLFTRTGQFIKKIAIRYIDIVAGLAITSQGHIVAVDSVSPTVFCISESGELIKWFDCSDYMREPSDIAVSGKDYYVCDFKGHCVVVFNEDGQFLHRIGCETITNYPNGIDISDAGDVLIGDSHGNRFHVAVFQRDGSLIGEFECPYVKVSRCCGLKITSEGYIVTLAKNNQHVLVLNTLYIA